MDEIVGVQWIVIRRPTPTRSGMILRPPGPRDRTGVPLLQAVQSSTSNQNARYADSINS